MPPNRTSSLSVFYELFEDRLSTKHYMQFYSSQRKQPNGMYLMSDLFTTDKLAGLILKEYGRADKLRGNVIVIDPEPA